MTYEEYVETMAKVLSGDHEKLAEANRVLFANLVTGEDAKRIPALALADIDHKVLTSSV